MKRQGGRIHAITLQARGSLDVSGRLQLLSTTGSGLLRSQGHTNLSSLLCPCFQAETRSTLPRLNSGLLEREQRFCEKGILHALDEAPDGHSL